MIIISHTCVLYDLSNNKRGEFNCISHFLILSSISSNNFNYYSPLIMNSFNSLAELYIQYKKECNFNLPSMPKFNTISVKSLEDDFLSQKLLFEITLSK